MDRRISKWSTWTRTARRRTARAAMPWRRRSGRGRPSTAAWPRRVAAAAHGPSRSRPHAAARSMRRHAADRRCGAVCAFRCARRRRRADRFANRRARVAGGVRPRLHAAARRRVRRSRSPAAPRGRRAAAAGVLPRARRGRNLRSPLRDPERRPALRLRGARHPQRRPRAGGRLRAHGVRRAVSGERPDAVPARPDRRVALSHRGRPHGAPGRARSPGRGRGRAHVDPRRRAARRQDSRRAQLHVT